MKSYSSPTKVSALGTAEPVTRSEAVADKIPVASASPSSSEIPTLYSEIRELVARSPREPELRAEIDRKIQQLRVLQEAEADALERRFEERLRLRSGTGWAHLQRLKELTSIDPSRFSWTGT